MKELKEVPRQRDLACPGHAWLTPHPRVAVQSASTGDLWLSSLGRYPLYPAVTGLPAQCPLSDGHAVPWKMTVCWVMGWSSFPGLDPLSNSRGEEQNPVPKIHQGPTPPQDL